jgi:hypothetical protein
MATKCESCGLEIKSDTPNRTVQTISEHFQSLESQLVEEGLTGGVLNSELIARKGRYIRDMGVPNSREDLLSLLHYIAPRLDAVSPDPNIEDWRSKFKEVVNLAKRSFKNDVKARTEVEDIERSVQVSMVGTLKGRAKRSPIIAIAAGIVTLFVFGGLISVQLQKHDDAQSLGQCEEAYEKDAAAEKARLEELLSKATSELKNSDHDSALTTISGISWDLKPECKQDAVAEKVKQWEQKRHDLEKLASSGKQTVINQKKEEAEALATQKKEDIEALAAKEKASAVKAARETRKAATDAEY